MRRLLFFAICFLAVLPAFAQTAEEIEKLLDTDVVSYAQAARLVLLAAENRDLSAEAAFTYASAQEWLPGRARANDAVRLSGLSLLVMRAFNIRGGAFYNLTGGAHYAYRELVYRNIIQGRSDPAMAVSGDLLLFTINRVLSFQETNQL